MTDDEEQEDIFIDIKKIWDKIDIRDCVILLLMVMMWLMVTISTNDITACNNYWLNRTAEKTIETIVNTTRFIYTG
jgi:hypothetical protein